MIDWEATKEQCDRSDLSGSRPKVVVKCDTCGASRIMAIRKKSKVVDGQMAWECLKCINSKPEKVEKARQAALQAWQSPEYRDKISENSKKLWKDSNFRDMMDELKNSQEFKDKVAQANRDKVTDESRAKCAENLKKRWQDPEYRVNMTTKLSKTSTEIWKHQEYRDKQISSIQANWRNKAYREATIAGMLAKWQDPEHRRKMLTVFASDAFRNKMSEVNKAVWARPGYKEKMEAVLSHARSCVVKVSSLQIVLYSLLDDLNIKYYREYEGHTDSECIIGPYTFDCVVPRENKPSLLIECQGEYWHSLPANMRNDAAKTTYITKHFAGKYELKHIWEDEFGCLDKVLNLLKYWMGIDVASVDFQFDDVKICATPANHYRLLLSKYHYLSNAGRGGVAHGAYLNGELIAVCVFSPPIRQNVDTGNYSKKQTKELSRLCIHPKYQKILHLGLLAGV